MQSDKQRKSNGYLNSILMNGAKPFLYRRGIRSLLGIPEDKGIRLLFSSVLPPAGFRYANRQFWDEPYISQSSLNEAERTSLNPVQKGSNKPSEGIVSKHIQCESPSSSEIEKGVHFRISQEKESGKDNVLKKAIVQHEVLMETKQEKAFIETGEKSKMPEEMYEKAEIKIPGNSEKSHNFSESPPFKRLDISSNKVNVNEQRQYEDSSSEVSENLIKESESKGELNNNPINSNVRAALASKKLQIKEACKIMDNITHLNNYNENQVADNIKTVYEDVSPAVKKQKKMPLQQTKALSFIDVEKKGVNPYQSFKASEAVGYGIDNSSSIKTADKIEQLRQSVHELASKRTMQQEKAENEKTGQLQEQTSPVMKREVVIIRRPLNRIRSPLAFWERSYLGHFYLRPLR